MTWKIWGELALAIGIFFAGYRYAAAVYGEEMAAMREAQSRAVQRLQREQIDEIAKREKRLATVVDERDAALSKLGTWQRSSGILLERMRDAELRARRVSASGVDSGIGTCRSDDRCRELLVRCGDLVARGGKLLGELNADREAVRGIVSQDTKSER